MRLSTRNQLRGTVATIEPGSVMTIVKVNLDGGQTVTASVTKEAVEDLALALRLPVMPSALVRAGVAVRRAGRLIPGWW